MSSRVPRAMRGGSQKVTNDDEGEGGGTIPPKIDDVIYEQPLVSSLRHYCPYWHYCLYSNAAIILWDSELCRKLWVYWGATILIARGLLFSSSLGPGSFAFHKVIYSRLQPFTASPLEMTLWNPSGPSAAMPRAAANTVCWQMDEVFLPQFNSLLKLLKFSMGNGHFASIICTQSISTPIQGIVLYVKFNGNWCWTSPTWSQVQLDQNWTWVELHEVIHHRLQSSPSRPNWSPTKRSRVGLQLGWDGLDLIHDEESWISCL